MRVLNIKETRKTRGGLISGGGGLITGCSFCLQVYGPIIGWFISGSQLRYTDFKNSKTTTTKYVSVILAFFFDEYVDRSPKILQEIQGLKRRSKLSLLTASIKFNVQ